MKLIVAFCKNRGIGYKNNLPWKLKSDLIRFKSLTIGDGNNAIVMGKNTWNSLNNKSLPKRSNIVLTSTPDKYSAYPGKFISSLQEVQKLKEKKIYDEIWVIGGERIYRETLRSDLIDEIFVTYINKNFICDTSFPGIPRKFNLIHATEIKYENDIEFNYVHYKKNILENNIKKIFSKKLGKFAKFPNHKS